MQFRASPLVGVMIIALAGSATADETNRWTGFYGGLSVATGEHSSSVDGAPTASFKKKGASLGVYGGYMFARPGSNFVWGPEFALTGYSGGGSANDATLGAVNNKDSTIFSARLRGGYDLGATLLYGHLGLGFTEGGATSAGATGTNIVGGVSYGLGAETALSDTWSARIDATRYDFSDSKAAFGANTRKRDAKSTVVSIGLTRKF